jgi:hypothetical protein
LHAPFGNTKQLPVGRLERSDVPYIRNAGAHSGGAIGADKIWREQDNAP